MAKGVLVKHEEDDEKSSNVRCFVVRRQWSSVSERKRGGMLNDSSK